MKMCTKDKIFGKIYLKAYRDTSFQCVVCNQERDVVRHEGKGEGSSSWSPKNNTLRSALGQITVTILKGMGESFLSKQQIYRV